MTARSSSFRALCLGLGLLAVLAAHASAAQSVQYRYPPKVVTVLRHHGDGDSVANEYDRGHEYILAMGLDGAAMAPPSGSFLTDGIPETEEAGETDESDKSLLRAGNTHIYAVGDYLRQVPASAKTTYETEGGLYKVDAEAFPSKYLEQELPIVRKPYVTERTSLLNNLYLEQEPAVVRKPFVTEKSSLLNALYLEQEPSVVRKPYVTEKSSLLNALYSVNSGSVHRNYLEQELPVVKKPFVTERTSLLNALYSVNAVNRKYLEQLPAATVSKTTEIVAQPIIKYSIQPRPVIKPVVNVLPAPVVKNYATVVRPIVQKQYNVLPAPVIRKYYAVVPPRQQEARPVVLNKYIKNTFVAPAAQRQQPLVVVPPSAPTKNVYNLIKVAAPLPAPTTPAPAPVAERIVFPEPVSTTPMPATTPEPTTTPLPATTAAPQAAALVAAADEAQVEEEEVREVEQRKVKSVGKMVVVETVRRVVDVPEFDGPAPPPTSSEETVVEKDGTIRKFEKYIEYDQIPAGAAEVVSSSHSKKQSAKSSSFAAAALVQGGVAQGAVAQDAAKASTSTGRSMSGSSPLWSHHASTLPLFSRQFSDSRADASRFAKALREPDNLEQAPEDLVLTPAEYSADQALGSLVIEPQLGAERRVEPAVLPATTTAVPPLPAA